jgi:L-histidine Nalpha-methyltransferase
MYPASDLARLTIQNRFESTSMGQMAEDAQRGFTAAQKFIPSKYFYDERGSRLFEQICHLPEYYLTRTELALLRRCAMMMTRGFRNGDIVELGSGANWKIRILLDALGKSRRSTIRYVPVDVSADALVAATQGLLGLYPELEVRGLVADFSCDLHWILSNRPKLVMFLGSTVGNLDRGETRILLQAVADNLLPTDRFFLGLDMVKPVKIMEAAYNDSQKVTAEFNKNVLLVLNREMGANFNPDDFEHVAFFNERLSQIEMHLRAKRRVVTHFSKMEWSVRIERGETIRTEISRKFSRSEVEALIEEAGLMVTEWHSDHRDWFSIAEIVLPRC